MEHDDITRALEAALALRDPVALDRVLSTVWSVGLTAEWAPVFAKLLVEHWHVAQEDLANALQDLRDPATSDALYQVAHDSTDYNKIDAGRALARKCVWALHDLGARDHLERLAATAGDGETRAHAKAKLELAMRSPADPPDAYRVSRDERVRR